MPGPPRKPAEDRQRRNKYPTLGTPAVPDRPVPMPPQGLRPSLLEEWTKFWQTPMAGLVAPSSMGALRRLFRQSERAMRAEEKAYSEDCEDPATWLRLATTIDAELRQLEDHFGMTPRSQLRFVSELEAAQRAEIAMHERAERPAEEGDDSAPLLADLEDGEDARAARSDVDGRPPRARRGGSRG